MGKVIKNTCDLEKNKDIKINRKIVLAKNSI